MLYFFRNMLLFGLLFLFSAGLMAQSEEYKPSRKALKAFESGLEEWRSRQFEKAEASLLKAIRLDTLYSQAYILLADLHMDRGRYGQAANWYSKAIALHPEQKDGLYYLLGQASLENRDYAGALEALDQYLRLEGIRRDKRDYAENLRELAYFRFQAIQDPVPFEPENLGPFVNSSNDEFVNSITLNEKKLVFTLMQPDSIIPGHYTEGFEMALKTDSGWVNAGSALPDLKVLGNVGAMSLSPDGNFLFFTSCGADGGYGSCDLYVCGRTNTGWSDPQNLGGVVNASSWDSQPCFSADGQTLYYSSSRGGGEGGSDIWMTKFTQGQGWSRPVNAGSAINSQEEEMAPFIHPDGQSMYFSSQGHTGMGGFDLFMSRIDSLGNWGKPVNLGYPVNTEGDEINIVVSTNGRAAYLSSDQEEGYGGYDIYRFELPEALAPRPVAYLEGRVYDAESLEGLEAEIELIDLQKGELSVRCASEPQNGNYLAALPGGKNYALNISKPGYMFFSENFNLALNDLQGEAYRLDVPLQAVKTGQSFTLNNVFFETDSFALDESSQVELFKLNAFLVHNPEVRIMICGHTDNTGSVSYNQELSEKRARSVYSFLLEIGIDPRRLEYKGFGKSQPVSDNKTEEGKAENRRTEILIL